MTKEQAEAMVCDLVDAVRDYERAEFTERRYCRQEYEAQRDRMIAALTSAYSEGE